MTTKAKLRKPLKSLAIFYFRNMIRIEIRSQYKSLSPIVYELPSLVVITGINGSGKTQFLEALENSQLSDIYQNNATTLPFRRLIRPQQLVPRIDIGGLIGSPADILWNTYTTSLNSPRRGNPPLELIFSSRNFRKIQKIAEYAKKDIRELQLEDFREHTPLNDANTSDDFLNQEFSAIFRNYFDKKKENDYRRYQNEWRNRKGVSFLTDEDFLLKYGNPRKDINDLIINAGLEYEFNEPQEIYEINSHSSFKIKLINKRNGTEIEFEDLSSGEKVIMSLVFALYNAKLAFSFPQTLLLDEPDTFLHPSMIKQFLDVIMSDFVKTQGMIVIITTHSPATVALAPEESLFVMNKTEPRLKKTTKDKALKILAEGVPTLSINYENRKQVIVESENDVYFYNKVYAKLSKELNPEISLTFISSGDTRTNSNGEKISNCKQVIDATTVFRKAGNKLVYGIIDWDRENSESDGVKVLGENKRYAIENYIFDPIMLAALLLDEGVISKDELGLEDNENYSDFKNFPVNKLQNISDFITNKIEEKLLPTNDNQVIPVRYKNGIVIEMPKWYLHYQCHDLEKFQNSYLKENFNLKKFHQPNAIRKQLIDKFIENMPDFISQDILEVFQSIQEV